MKVSKRFGLVAVVVGCAGLLGAIAVLKAQNRALSQELKSRGATEGLALVRVQSNWMEIIAFDTGTDDIPNPRGISGAWASPTGSFTAWDIVPWPDEEFEACPSPIVVDAADGTTAWQLHGNVINTSAVGVSADGKRVAFFGTYKPPGTGVLNTSENNARWVTGLQLAESGTRTAKLILRTESDSELSPDAINSISWSPDNDAFAYDFRGQIFVYEISTSSSHALVRGTNPIWSPDGMWISFRTLDGEGQAINAKTRETKKVVPGRKILWGVHWSPDSRYVMFSEELGFMANLFGGNPFLGTSGRMVVLRLSDGTSVPVHWFSFKGGDDRSFFWVKDYKDFVRNASIPPVMRECEQP